MSCMHSVGHGDRAFEPFCVAAVASFGKYDGLASLMQAGFSTMRSMTSGRSLLQGRKRAIRILWAMHHGEALHARLIERIIAQRMPRACARLVAAFVVDRCPDPECSCHAVVRNWDQSCDASVNIAVVDQASLPEQVAASIDDARSVRCEVIPGNQLGCFTGSQEAAHPISTRGPGPEIIQQVFHTDPPVRISPAEAAMIAANLETGLIERVAVACSGEPIVQDDMPSDHEQLFAVQFKRCPSELLDVLSNGPALRAVRRALVEANHVWKLPNGHMIFVHPWQYKVAMSTKLPEWSTFTVIFAESLEHFVEASITDIGRGAVVKQRTVIESHGAVIDEATAGEVGSTHELDESPQEDEVLIEVTRTFLQPVPVRRSASSVAQSSTELHGGGLNPRCCVAAIPDGLNL